MPRSRRDERGEVTTVREFTGGWNVVDSEFNMSPRYARIMRNVVRQPDGTIAVRYGTELFADIAAFGMGNLVNMEYFSTFIVACTSLGALIAIDGQGTAFLIWSPAIAAGLLGSPKFWSPTSFASFTPFKGILIVANGIDKPLRVNKNMTVSYLVDPSTGSNFNTPIARYGAASPGETSGYFVFAGDLLKPAILHIGAADSIGTFVGDPTPNDSIQYDLGSKVTEGDGTIRGIRFFRDRLLVAFDELTIAMQLGVYNAVNAHTPVVTDILEGFGSLGHRTMFPIEAELHLADNVGTSKISRARLSTSLVAVRTSDLIEPEYQKSIQSLSLAATEDRVFALQNHNEGQYMLFVPNHSNLVNTTESRGFLYTLNPKESSWSEVVDWNWTCSCHSLQNNIFFGRDTRIYRYGNVVAPLNADYVDEQETFDDGTAFTDNTGFVPLATDSIGGLPITWSWELPWADFDRRLNMKKSMFFGADAGGSGRFNVHMFVDNVYLDPSDPGEAHTDETLFDDDLGYVREDPILLPALSHEFFGGAQSGFGADSFGAEFGGGHVVSLPKLYRWPARFKIAKFRFEGYDSKELNIASFSVAYTKGKLRR